MNITKTFYLQCQWTKPDAFFLWANKPSGHTVDPHELKWQLFAWHEPSFYGHFVETGKMGRTPGIRLPAALALELFAELPANPKAELHWSGDARRFIRMAPRILEALTRDRFSPDRAKWAQGKLGWKIRGEQDQTDREADNDLLDDWITAILSDPAQAQRFGQDRSLERLKSQMALSRGILSNEKATERDWLMSIGWIQDDCPFRVCLRLGEPGDWQTRWPLSIMLQGKSDERTAAICDETGAPYEPLPEAWVPYRKRIRQELHKWLRLVPRLMQAHDSEALGGETLRLRSSLSDQEAWRLLAEDSQTLAEAGCTVVLPAWWQQIRPARFKMKMQVSLARGMLQDGKQIGLDQLLDYDWKISLGGEEISEADFLRIVEEDRRLIRLGREWVQLDQITLDQLREAMREAGGHSPHERGGQLRSLFRKLSRGGPDGDSLKFDISDKGVTLGNVLSQYLLQTGMPDDRQLEDLMGEGDGRTDVVMEPDAQTAALLKEMFLQKPETPPEMPKQFLGSLRSYQAEGAYWLYSLRRRGFGACLADDMGLGKTIQFIAYLLYVKENLVPDRVSLLVCPTSVLGNWQKELERFAPNLRVRTHHGSDRSKAADEFHFDLEGTDIVLTSYALVHQDRELLQQIHWDCVCLDEAQNIKNPYTKQASSVRKLQAVQKIAMTGTPVENHLHELWSIFHTILPGYLGSLKHFQERFAAPVERSRDDVRGQMLRRLVQPFLLRRSKNDPDVELDLPEKIESKLYVPLTVEQAALYERTVQGVFERIRQTAAMQRRGLVLASLTSLKQICDHPSLYLREAGTAVRSAAGAGRAAERSGKLARLLELFDEVRERDEQCLIFTQYVDMGRLLKSVLEAKFDEAVQFLHGGTPKKQRDTMIDSFQNGHAADGRRTRCFILSLKAGGTGLNLTAANHVFHYDRWWNPAVENQATDRAHRIGQTRSVNVYKFVTLGTMEERINEMIERKTEISRTIIRSSGEGWITELSDDELMELFGR